MATATVRLFVGVDTSQIGIASLLDHCKGLLRHFGVSLDRLELLFEVVSMFVEVLVQIVKLCQYLTVRYYQSLTSR